MKHILLLMLFIAAMGCARHVNSNQSPNYNIAIKSLTEMGVQQVELLPIESAKEQFAKKYQKFATPIDVKRDIALRNKTTGDIFLFIFNDADTYQRYDCDRTYTIKNAGLLDR